MIMDRLVATVYRRCRKVSTTVVTTAHALSTSLAELPLASPGWRLRVCAIIVFEIGLRTRFISDPLLLVACCHPPRQKRQAQVGAAG